MMSYQYVGLLFYECKKKIPNMIKINEYIIRICNNKENINTRFQYFRLTILHMACSRGHHEIVKILLENSKYFKYPIDVNAIGDWNDSAPLHCACQADCSLTVRTLLLHPNIEVNKCDRVKETPLHVACCVENSSKAVIELLKHKNINLNATSQSYCSTPLHHACYYKDSPAAVQLLLEHATITDINATDKDGNTPLHKACSRYTIKKEKINVVRNLLKQTSIIINKKNNNYESPLEICQRTLDETLCAHEKHCSNGIIQLLEDYHIKQRWRVFLLNHKL